MKIAGVVVGVCIAHLAQGAEVSGTISGVKDPENVVVYLEHVDGTFPAPAEHAIMDQQNMRFVPHVLPVLSGATVDFPNSDTVRHNVFSPSKAKKFNLGIYASGTTKTVTMDIVCPVAGDVRPARGSLAV